MVCMPMKMKPVEMEIQRRLAYLKRSLTLTQLPSYCCRLRGCSSLNSYSEINYLLLIFPIWFNTFNVRAGLFSIRYIGVSFRNTYRGTCAATNNTNRITMIIRQVRSDRKMRAMVDSPRARPSCTPTPNLCRDFPRLCSLMKEKARVMAGLVPKPMKKSPNPTMRGESAIRVARSEIMPTTQATLRAFFLPELSAIFGITKKPTSAPKKSIDCSIGI